MGLNISRTDILLDVDRTPAKMNMETQIAKLELHQKHAKVNIHSKLPKIQIDQYECFAEEGLKNNYDLIRELAQRGYNQALEYIGKTAEDGNTLAAIERGGNPIAAICKRDSYTVHEFGLDTIPKSRPYISVIEGELDIEPERNWEGANSGVEGNYIPGYVNYDFTPSKINTYVKQYPSVSFSYTGNNLDTRI